MFKSNILYTNVFFYIVYVYISIYMCVCVNEQTCDLASPGQNPWRHHQKMPMPSQAPEIDSEPKQKLMFESCQIDIGTSQKKRWLWVPQPPFLKIKLDNLGHPYVETVANKCSCPGCWCRPLALPTTSPCCHSHRQVTLRGSELGRLVRAGRMQSTFCRFVDTYSYLNTCLTSNPLPQSHSKNPVVLSPAMFWMVFAPPSRSAR